jgi:hypothetical protein
VYPKSFVPRRKAVNASGAAGGLKDAVASAAPSASAALLLFIDVAADAENVAREAGTAAHGIDPRVYLTLEARVVPPDVRVASGTSVARLKRRTFDPVFGGTNDAAIISMLFPSFGGQLPPLPGGGPVGGPPVSAMTRGPGVRNLVAVRSVLPPDLTVTWPLPTANLVTQPLNCENL